VALGISRSVPDEFREFAERTCDHAVYRIPFHSDHPANLLMHRGRVFAILSERALKLLEILSDFDSTIRSEDKQCAVADQSPQAVASNSNLRWLQVPDLNLRSYHGSPRGLRSQIGHSILRITEAEKALPHSEVET